VRAHLVAAGSELLRFGRHDANGEWLQARLERAGVEVASRAVVEDDARSIAAAVRAAAECAEVVLVTGGLGATADDRTREALGLAFPDLVGAALDNPAGQAPGVALAPGSCRIFALPGVPHEMRAMFERHVAPVVDGLPPAGLASRRLGVAGRSESDVDRAIGDLAPLEGVVVTTLATAEGVDVHLRGVAADVRGAAERVAAAAARIRARLGPDAYGEEGETLASVTGSLLVERGWTLAAAESCTGGLLAGAITAVPGASAWFRGGLVVYDDRLKTALAGVDPPTLSRHGAVSAEVAAELARGARLRVGADVGMGLTGIAGPGGGSEQKPVGRVHVAIDDGEVVHATLSLSGDRDRIRRRAVAVALDRLRRRLLERR